MLSFPFVSTSERCIEEALRASERRFRATFEQAAVGIAHVGLNGQCLLVNQTLCAITGYTREELLTRQFQGFIGPAAGDAAQARIRRLLDTDPVQSQRLVRGDLQTYTLEKPYVRKDQVPIWLTLTVSLAHTPAGAPEYFIAIVQDMTERKQAENALRDIRERERRRIARDLHDVVLQDLVYALQGLQATGHTAADAGVRAALAPDITALRQAVQGVRSAIYNLRCDEADGQSLLQIVESLVHRHRQMAPHQEIQLVIQDGILPTLPVVAAIELAHIIQEALVNARRHAAARAIVVTLGANEHEVWADVVDDGRGFELETARGGVGFAAMRERADGLGGQLTIESTVGQGARVRFQVPLAGVTEISDDGR